MKRKTSIVLCACLFTIFLNNCLGMGNQSFDNVDIDLSNIEDGSYKGEATVGHAKVELIVHVQNNSIIDIEVLNPEPATKEPAEAITRAIIENQSIHVDGISGATMTSDAIKISVKKALSFD